MASNDDDDDIDIYEDLPHFNLEETLQKLESENKVLSQQVKELTAKVEELEAVNKELEKVNKNLSANISVLYKTAKLELDRKNNTIQQLTSERDDICFRRFTRGGTDNRRPFSYVNGITADLDARHGRASEETRRICENPNVKGHEENESQVPKAKDPSLNPEEKIQRGKERSTSETRRNPTSPRKKICKNDDPSTSESRESSDPLEKIRQGYESSTSDSRRKSSSSREKNRLEDTGKSSSVESNARSLNCRESNREEEKSSILESRERSSIARDKSQDKRREQKEESSTLELKRSANLKEKYHKDEPYTSESRRKSSNPKEKIRREDEFSTSKSRSKSSHSREKSRPEEKSKNTTSRSRSSSSKEKNRQEDESSTTKSRGRASNPRKKSSQEKKNPIAESRQTAKSSKEDKIKTNREEAESEALPDKSSSSRRSKTKSSAKTSVTNSGSQSSTVPKLDTKDSPGSLSGNVPRTGASRLSLHSERSENSAKDNASVILSEPTPNATSFKKDSDNLKATNDVVVNDTNTTGRQALPTTPDDEPNAYVSTSQTVQQTRGEEAQSEPAKTVPSHLNRRSTCSVSSIADDDASVSPPIPNATSSKKGNDNLKANLVDGATNDIVIRDASTTSRPETDVSSSHMLQDVLGEAAQSELAKTVPSRLSLSSKRSDNCAGGNAPVSIPTPNTAPSSNDVDNFKTHLVEGATNDVAANDVTNRQALPTTSNGEPKTDDPSSQTLQQTRDEEAKSVLPCLSPRSVNKSKDAASVSLSTSNTALPTTANDGSEMDVLFSHMPKEIQGEEARLEPPAKSKEESTQNGNQAEANKNELREDQSQANVTSPKKRRRPQPVIYFKTRSSARLSAKLQNPVKETENEASGDVSILQVLQLKKKRRTSNSLNTPNELLSALDHEKRTSSDAQKVLELPLSTDTPSDGTAEKQNQRVVAFSLSESGPVDTEVTPFSSNEPAPHPPRPDEMAVLFTALSACAATEASSREEVSQFSVTDHLSVHCSTSSEITALPDKSTFSASTSNAVKPPDVLTDQKEIQCNESRYSSLGANDVRPGTSAADNKKESDRADDSIASATVNDLSIASDGIEALLEKVFGCSPAKPDTRKVQYEEVSTALSTENDCPTTYSPVRTGREETLREKDFRTSPAVTSSVELGTKEIQREEVSPPPSAENDHPVVSPAATTGTEETLSEKVLRSSFDIDDNAAVTSSAKTDTTGIRREEVPGASSAENGHSTTYSPAVSNIEDAPQEEVSRSLAAPSDIPVKTYARETQCEEVSSLSSAVKDHAAARSSATIDTKKAPLEEVSATLSSASDTPSVPPAPRSSATIDMKKAPHEEVSATSSSEKDTSLVFPAVSFIMRETSSDTVPAGIKPPTEVLLPTAARIEVPLGETSSVANSADDRLILISPENKVVPCENVPTSPVDVNEESALKCITSRNNSNDAGAVGGMPEIKSNHCDKPNSNALTLQWDFKVRRRTKVEVKMVIKPATVATNLGSLHPKTADEVPHSSRSRSRSPRRSHPKTADQVPHNSHSLSRSPRRSHPKTADQVPHNSHSLSRSPRRSHPKTADQVPHSSLRSPRRSQRENFPPDRADHDQRRGQHFKDHRSPPGRRPPSYHRSPPCYRPSRKDERRTREFDVSRRSRSCSPFVRAQRQRDHEKDDHKAEDRRPRPSKLPADRKEREILLFGRSPERTSDRPQQPNRDPVRPQRPLVLTVNRLRKGNVRLEDSVEDKKATPVQLTNTVNSSLASCLVQTPLDFRERYAEVFSNTGESDSGEEDLSFSDSQSPDSAGSDVSYRPKGRKRKKGCLSSKAGTKRQRTHVGR